MRTPGEALREALDARGWTQADLAFVIGRPAQMISKIVNNRKRITTDTAIALGIAFGNGARHWLDIDGAYRLSQLPPVDPGIAIRATLRGVLGPKRGRCVRTPQPSRCDEPSASAIWAAGPRDDAAKYVVPVRRTRGFAIVRCT